MKLNVFSFLCHGEFYIISNIQKKIVDSLDEKFAINVCSLNMKYEANKKRQKMSTI